MTSEILANYLDACKEAIKIASSIDLDIPKPSTIIFTGMGGSGISGNLVEDVVKDDIPIPIEVLKGYYLPRYADRNTLVVCTSYSGNTEETLSQFVEAVKRGCHTVAISSGAKLVELTKRLGTPLLQVPAGYQPRETIPYLFFSLLSCLEKIGLKDFSEDKKEFLSLMSEIALSRMDKLAEEIKDSMPVLYSSSDFSGVLRRIKSQLNENSKMLARFDELPELNHNEVVAYEIFDYPDVSVVFLRDKDEKPEITKRIEITKEILKGKVKNIHEIWTYGNSKLAKVMSLVYQGDYLSFKLAELRNVDWKQAKTIDKVKQELKSLNTVEKLEKSLGFIS